MILSCLCASTPRRWSFLQRSIADFVAQTYAMMELIIVVSDKSYADTIWSYAAQLGDGGKLIKIFHRKHARSAQDCYWHAMTYARGDFITLWDDANLNAPHRITAQMVEQSNRPTVATALSSGFYYFYETRELFPLAIIDPKAKASGRCLANTLIVPRDRMPPLDGLMRANPIGLLADEVGKSCKLVTIPMSFLHVVGVVGDDIRTYDKHRHFGAASSHVYQVGRITGIESSLTKCLDAIGWDDGPITVCGTDGAAFTYTPKQIWSNVSSLVLPDDGIERVTETVEP